MVGKIYLDCNQNRVQDHEEMGDPGVRFYLEDGTYLESGCGRQMQLLRHRPPRMC
ncbi:MAG: hypothetical protein IPJ97_16730 [Proteobacteria bacterium]|nr:hypothetical protein [Pseudomonadota bacterium]